LPQVINVDDDLPLVERFRFGDLDDTTFTDGIAPQAKQASAESICRRCSIVLEQLFELVVELLRAREGIQVLLGEVRLLLRPFNALGPLRLL
jgi:hypothetical protein